MNSALLQQAIENLLPPTPIQTTSGIGTKRRKPSASLHAYKVCKLKQDPAPYVHNFTEDEASKKMKKSNWSEVPPSKTQNSIYTILHYEVRSSKTQNSMYYLKIKRLRYSKRIDAFVKDAEFNVLSKDDPTLVTAL